MNSSVQVPYGKGTMKIRGNDRFIFMLGVLTVVDHPPKVQFYDAHSGFLQWEQPFNNGNVFATTISTDSLNVIVAADSQVITKISARTGQSDWTVQRPENTLGDEIVSLHYRKQQLYIIERLRAKSSIQVTAVDMETGDIGKTNEFSTAAAIHNLVVAGDYVVWTEKDTIKWAELDAKRVQSANIAVSGLEKNMFNLAKEAERIDKKI